METNNTESVLMQLLSEVDAMPKEEALRFLEKIIAHEKKDSLSDDYLRELKKDTRDGHEIAEFVYGINHVEASLVLKLLKAFLTA